MYYSPKRRLLQKALYRPLEFSNNDVDKLLSLRDSEALTFSDLREALKSVFDVNEEILLQDSDASKGDLAAPNHKNWLKRRKRYYKKIVRGHRLKEGNKVILAEGDSWFQFPMLVKEIIDWLNRKNKHFAIYSIAYAGDWLANIIYQGTYIAELPIHRPDVFLISGGGNDLLGSNRLALMVDKNGYKPRYNSIDELRLQSPNASDEDLQDILAAQPFVTREFYAFVNILKLQYRLLFDSIYRSSKYEDLLILTQGYDYGIPHKLRLLHPRLPIKWLENLWVGSGKWLKQPLMLKGIPPRQDARDIHHAVVKALLFEINEMFIDTARHYDKVFHIDCRGTARNIYDWLDEIHLRSRVYRKVAYGYSIFINHYFKRGKPVTDPEVLSQFDKKIIPVRLMVDRGIITKRWTLVDWFFP